jgi:hypothetical protein
MMRNRRKLTPQQLVFIVFVSAPLLIAATTFSAPMSLRPSGYRSPAATVHHCPGPGACIFPHHRSVEPQTALTFIFSPHLATE